MVPTHIDVKLFNVIRYALTSLVLVPCLEWALQNIVESFAARHLLRGGIVRWGGHRLGRLSPVPYSYDRKTSLFAIGAGLLIHSASLLGEFGFDSEPIDLRKETPFLRSNASSIPAYISMCYEKELRIQYLDGTAHRNITKIFDRPEDCSVRRKEYVKGSNFNYRVLKEEILDNYNSVFSTVIENEDLDWQSSTCRSGEEGRIRYNFTISKSRTRKYRNLTIDLPLEAVNATFHIPYRCDSEGLAKLDWPIHDLKNVTGLPNTVTTAGLSLKQNKTFTCVGTDEFRGWFCFSNKTSSVRKLYHSITQFPGSYEPFEKIYLFAEFDPPVEVSRVYFILSGIHHYQPLLLMFTRYPTAEVMLWYNRIGSVLTLLLAMPEVLAVEGERVDSITGTTIAATIEIEGLAYLSVLSFTTISALLIAFLCFCVATKDSRGRVVKVKSESKYVIDLLAKDILGNEDCPPLFGSHFGIALKSDGRGRNQICISQDGVEYKGGTVGECINQSNIQTRKRKRG